MFAEGGRPAGGKAELTCSMRHSGGSGLIFWQHCEQGIFRLQERLALNTCGSTRKLEKAQWRAVRQKALPIGAIQI